MKSIRNKTLRPLRVHLSQGKILHLGPRKEGQIAAHDVDLDGVQRLIANGDIEVVGDGSDDGAGAPPEPGHVQTDTHGHHPDLTVKKRGER